MRRVRDACTLIDSGSQEELLILINPTKYRAWNLGPSAVGSHEALGFGGHQELCCPRSRSIVSLSSLAKTVDGEFVTFVSLSRSTSRSAFARSNAPLLAHNIVSSQRAKYTLACAKDRRVARESLKTPCDTGWKWNLSETQPRTLLPLT